MKSYNVENNLKNTGNKSVIDKPITIKADNNKKPTNDKKPVNDRIRMAEKFNEEIKSHNDEVDEEQIDAVETDIESEYTESSSKTKIIGKILTVLLVVAAMAISAVVGYGVGSTSTIRRINAQLEAERNKEDEAASTTYYLTTINPYDYEVKPDELIIFTCDGNNLNANMKIEYVIEDLTTGTLCMSNVLFGNDAINWQPAANIADKNIKHTIRITQNVFSASDVTCQNLLHSESSEITVTIVDERDDSDYTNNSSDTDNSGTDNSDSTGDSE